LAVQAWVLAWYLWLQTDLAAVVAKDSFRQRNSQEMARENRSTDYNWVGNVHLLML
jgi:hypothetical protein